MGVPQKIFKNGTALWPSDSTSGHKSEEIQNTNSKEYIHLICTIMFIAVLFTITKIGSSPSVHRKWVGKTAVVHLHNGIQLSLKKGENITLVTVQMELEESYSQWNNPVLERQVSYDFTHMWNVMNKLNWQGKWGQTHRWRAGCQLVGYLGGGGIEQKGKWTHGHGQQCGDC